MPFENHAERRDETAVTKTEGARTFVTASFPFNFKLFCSVHALSLALVSILATRRLIWLLSFVCALTAVCGSQLQQDVSGFDMVACILRFNRRPQINSVFWHC